MSNSTNQDNIIPLETLAPGTDITIVVNTDVYIRLQQVLLEALPWKDLTHFQLVMKAINDKITLKDEPLQYHAESLLYTLGLIESSAKAAGSIKKVNFDLSQGKVVPEAAH